MAKLKQRKPLRATLGSVLKSLKGASTIPPKGNYRQMVSIDGQDCVIVTGSNAFHISINEDGLRKFFKSLGWEFMIAFTWLSYLSLYKIKYFFKDRIGYVLGSYNGCLRKIIISPENILHYSRDREEFEENLCWVLAHELCHHRQFMQKSIWARYYHGSEEALGMQVKALDYFRRQKYLAFIYLPVSIFFTLIYCFPYLALFICEYQAERFARKQTEQNMDILKECITVTYGPITVDTASKAASKAAKQN